MPTLHPSLKLRLVFRRTVRLVLDLHGVNLSDGARVARENPELCSELLVAVSAMNRAIADALKLPKRADLAFVLALARGNQSAGHAEGYMQQIIDCGLYGARGPGIQRQLRVIRQMLRGFDPMGRVPALRGLNVLPRAP